MVTLELFGLQYRERIIFLSKAVDDELGNQLVATMLYLDSENHKDMQLYINCSGGEVSIVVSTRVVALVQKRCCGAHVGTSA